MKDRAKNGLVQIYTGSGKGKTTAAMGLALRAASQGHSVSIFQFLKRSAHGETKLLKKIKNISVSQCGTGCFIRSNPKKIDIDHAERGMTKAYRAILSGTTDLVILDEINPAMNSGLIDPAAVAEMIKHRPKNVEIVLTGRYCPASILRLADLVTEMKKVRHPYDKGVFARRGIEF